MAIQQEIWSLDNKKKLDSASLLSEEELEDFIYSDIDVLNKDWIIIGRQVRTVAGGFIDILCIDREGCTVVVELKKDKTPREVTAQAIDYASCVSKYHTEDLAKIYIEYSNGAQTLNNAFQAKFHTDLDESTINDKVKIVVVAAQMDSSTERIIDYLGQFNIDINILFFRVFEHAGVRLLSRAWYREEEAVPSVVSSVSREWNNEFYVSFGADESRSWEDAVKYGFISAGGGLWYTKTLDMLQEDDRVWVNIPHKGYVGVGKVIVPATTVSHLEFNDSPFLQLNLHGNYLKDRVGTEEEECIVLIDWIKTVPFSGAVKELGFFGNQNTVCRPTCEKWDYTVERLKAIWSIAD